MKLICSHCGEVFVIGEAAFLVTDEDKYHGLREANAAVLSSRRPARKPDLAQHWTRPTSSEERSTEQQKATEIEAAIAQGEQRQWWCGKCYNEIPNNY